MDKESEGKMLLTGLDIVRSMSEVSKDLAAVK